MPTLLTSRHFFDDKFSTRTSIQTKSKCSIYTCNTHSSSFKALSQMHCNIFKGTSIILEHKGRIKIKFIEQGDMKM